jgi:hypothetical protein
MTVFGNIMMEMGVTFEKDKMNELVFDASTIGFMLWVAKNREDILRDALEFPNIPEALKTHLIL